MKNYSYHLKNKFSNLPVLLQGPTQGQSHLVKEKGGRTRKRLENFKSTRITKVCWNGGGDNDHEKDHSWSSFDQLSLRTSRNDIKQGRSIFLKGTQREAKLASDSHQSVKGKKNDHRLEVDSTPKSQKAFQRQCTMDSSESTKSQPLTNETSFQEPAAEATEASDKPVLPINDSVAKPAWVAVDEKTNVPGRRWRKALALRANGKRLKETRDLAAVYEEYDLMIHNLKQFGVL